MLIGISVRSFRILRDVRLGVTQKTLSSFLEDGAKRQTSPPLRQLAVLVGDNRSGKSSLLEALAFLRDAVLYGADKASKMERREGLDDLVTEGLGEDFRMELCFLTADRTRIYSYTAVIGRQDEGACFKEENLRLLPVTADILAYLAFADKEPQDLPTETSWETLLERDGTCETGEENVHSALAQATYRDLEAGAKHLYNYLSNIFILRPAKDGDNGYVDLKKHGKEPAKSPAEEPELERDGSNIREWLAYWRTHDPAYYRALSDKLKSILHIEYKGGISEWLGRLTGAEVNLCLIIVLLSSKVHKPLLCIENPDAGLFPDKVDLLTREMRDYTLFNPDSQLLMTTMHMNLLESMSPEEVWAFTLNGKTHTGRETQTDENGIPQVRVRSASEDPLIMAMYREGIGLGTLLYGGYFA